MDPFAFYWARLPPWSLEEMPEYEADLPEAVLPLFLSLNWAKAQKGFCYYFPVHKSVVYFFPTSSQKEFEQTGIGHWALFSLLILSVYKQRFFNVGHVSAQRKTYGYTGHSFQSALIIKTVKHYLHRLKKGNDHFVSVWSWISPSCYTHIKNKSYPFTQAVPAPVRTDLFPTPCKY